MSNNENIEISIPSSETSEPTGAEVDPTGAPPATVTPIEPRAVPSPAAEATDTRGRPIAETGGNGERNGESADPVPPSDEENGDLPAGLVERYMAIFLPGRSRFQLWEGGNFRRGTRRDRTTENVRRGLAGGPPIVAPLVAGRRSQAIGLDLDDIDDDQLRRLPEILSRTGVVPRRAVVMERSGGRNRAHVWIVLSTQVAEAEASLVAGELKTHIEEAGYRGIEAFPRAGGAGIRLPAMRSHKNLGRNAEELAREGRNPGGIVVDPQTLLPVEHPVAFLVGAPRAPARPLAEWARARTIGRGEGAPGGLFVSREDAGPAAPVLHKLRPCVQRVFALDITEDGQRHWRMKGIALDLRRIGCREQVIAAALSYFATRRYRRAEGATSQADVAERIQGLARWADNKSGFFTCHSRSSDLHRFTDFCDPSCHRNRNRPAPGIPQRALDRDDLTVVDAKLLERHDRASAAAAAQGYPLHFLSAAEEADGITTLAHARKRRKYLVEIGELRPVDRSAVPEWLLIANGHSPRSRQTAPPYYHLRPCSSQVAAAPSTIPAPAPAAPPSGPTAAAPAGSTPLPPPSLGDTGCLPIENGHGGTPSGSPREWGNAAPDTPAEVPAAALVEDAAKEAECSDEHEPPAEAGGHGGSPHGEPIPTPVAAGRLTKYDMIRKHLDSMTLEEITESARKLRESPDYDGVEFEDLEDERERHWEERWLRRATSFARTTMDEFKADYVAEFWRRHLP